METEEGCDRRSLPVTKSRHFGGVLFYIRLHSTFGGKNVGGTMLAVDDI